jgi:hypothetical protein
MAASSCSKIFCNRSLSTTSFCHGFAPSPKRELLDSVKDGLEKNKLEDLQCASHSDSVVNFSVIAGT